MPRWPATSESGSGKCRMSQRRPTAVSRETAPRASTCHRPDCHSTVPEGGSSTARIVLERSPLPEVAPILLAIRAPGASALVGAQGSARDLQAIVQSRNLAPRRLVGESE
jgi:hypothetical protein